jgi:hypothetical protein
MLNIIFVHPFPHSALSLPASFAVPAHCESPSFLSHPQSDDNKGVMENLAETMCFTRASLDDRCPLLVARGTFSLLLSPVNINNNDNKVLNQDSRLGDAGSSRVRDSSSSGWDIASQQLRTAMQLANDPPIVLMSPLNALPPDESLFGQQQAGRRDADPSQQGREEGGRTEQLGDDADQEPQLITVDGLAPKQETGAKDSQAGQQQQDGGGGAGAAMSVRGGLAAPTVRVQAIPQPRPVQRWPLSDIRGWFSAIPGVSEAALSGSASTTGSSSTHAVQASAGGTLPGRGGTAGRAPQPWLPPNVHLVTVMPLATPGRLLVRLAHMYQVCQ